MGFFASKINNASQAVTFDDVLIRPAYSDVLVEQVDVSTFVARGVKLKVPIISSPMDTVTESSLAKAVARKGGVGVIHYNMSVEKQSSQVHEVKKEGLLVGAAVGVADEERVNALLAKEVDFVVIDSAHGHKATVINATKKYKAIGAVVVAGNITSAKAAEDLISAGADGLRVGTGPGAICTTRVVTGIGVPQLTAVSEVADFAKAHKVPVIADGGIRYSGDLAKALAAGANCGMFGNAFAGTTEAPSELVELNGEKFKKYRGMGSLESMKANYAGRYDAFKKALVPEGVSGLVKYTGSVEDVINQFEGGLKKALVYVGAKNLDEFQEKAILVKITASGVVESHPHSLIEFDETVNYSGRG